MDPGTEMPSSVLLIAGLAAGTFGLSQLVLCQALPGQGEFPKEVSVPSVRVEI